MTWDNQFDKLSTAQLATRAGLKFTNLHKRGMHYFCNLDGVLVQVISARRELIAKLKQA